MLFRSSHHVSGNVYNIFESQSRVGTHLGASELPYFPVSSDAQTRHIPITKNKPPKAETQLTEAFPSNFGRGDRTRTGDPYVPNVVRYQLRYTPIKNCMFSYPGAKLLLFFEITKKITRNLQKVCKLFGRLKKRQYLCIAIRKYSA